MSKYTTELGMILESGYDLGLQDYEVFSEEYRTKLNQKIYNHYYFHEIGFETANKFKHYLNTTMNEIMPYYNQLLQSQLISFDPLLSFKNQKVYVSNLDKTQDKTETLASTQQDTSTQTKNIDYDETQSLTDTTVTDNDKTSSQTLQNDSTITASGTSASDETQTETDVMDRDTTLTTSKTTNSDKHDDGKDVFYDTPQGSLGDITDSNYATNVTKKDLFTSNTIVDSATQTESEDVTKNKNLVIDNDSSTTQSTVSANTSTTSATDAEDETITKTVTQTGAQDTTETNNITNNQNGSNNLTANITDATTQTDTENNEGTQIPFSELMLKYRETFLNVDVLVINELKPLFMQIY